MAAIVVNKSDNVVAYFTLAADCLKYENGEYTILTDVVDTLNEKYAEVGAGKVEVEI
jgi:hypothetical protein